MTPTATGEQQRTAVPLVRRRVVDAAGRVVGYAVHGWDGVPTDLDGADLSVLTTGQPLYLHLPASAVLGVQGWPEQVVVMTTPARWADADERAATQQLLAAGADLGLSGGPDDPLPDAAATVELRADEPDLAAAVSAAHAAGARVVVDAGGSSQAHARAVRAGADGVAVEFVPDDVVRVPGFFTASELNSLELLNLLDEEEPDMAAVVGLVAADPALSVQVLRLVNSPAMGLRSSVDSVRRAAVMVGPRRLRSIALTSLVGSTQLATDDLWQMLTRALVVWELTDDDAGYTVGMLSALADLRRFPIAWMAAEAKVSDMLVDALVNGSGPLGTALTAAVAYESGRTAPGVASSTVAAAWWSALPEARGIAEALGA